MLKQTLILFVVAATVLSSSCHRSPEQQTCSIVLLSPRTGTQSAIGSQIGRARLLVEEELRNAGDASVTIREVDTEGQPAVARAELDRALQRWRAPIVVGSILSTETREFLQPTLQRGVVVLANGSSDPTIRSLPFRRKKDGFFRNWPSDDTEGRAMAEYLRTTGRAKKLAVFHANDAYARALVEAFVQRFRELGGEILGPEVYQPDATSFESVLRRLPQDGHDGYYIVGLPPDLAGMYNAIRRSPMGSKTPIFTAVAAETAEFKALVRTDLDNIFFTAPSVDESSSSYFDFREAYRKRFNGDSPDVVAGITYDALRIAIEATKKGACDPASIKEYLYKMPTFHGATGPTAFDDLGDVISKPVAIRYYDKGQLRTAVQTSGVH
jgi:ABC-type branched-subunit amino acid transport system substrate-binding protein